MKKERPARRIAPRPGKGSGVAVAGITSDRLATVIAGAIVLALVAGIGIVVVTAGRGAFRYVMNDERYVVEQIDVEGVKALSASEVISRGGIQKGAPIFEVDLVAVRDRIMAHPRVADVVVERHLPQRMLISVTERTPVGLVQRNGAIQGIDITGTIVPLVPAREDVKGPIITGEFSERSEILVEAISIVELLRPDLIGRVSEIRIDPSAGITLLTTESVTVIRLGRGEMADKIERLRAAYKLFDQKNERKDYIDLRFKDLVTRP